MLKQIIFKFKGFFRQFLNYASERVDFKKYLRKKISVFARCFTFSPEYVMLQTFMNSMSF